MCRNDPDAVLATLAAAFEDNEAAAAAVGVAGAEVTVVVILPGASAVPERGPSTTAAGNFTLKKLNKSESAAFYMLLVCGHVLVTVKETFAVAPSISAVRRDAVGRLEPARRVCPSRPRVGWQYGSDPSHQDPDMKTPQRIVASRLEPT